MLHSYFLLKEFPFPSVVAQQKRKKNILFNAKLPFPVIFCQHKSKHNLSSGTKDVQKQKVYSSWAQTDDMIDAVVND